MRICRHITFLILFQVSSRFIALFYINSFLCINLILQKILSPLAGKSESFVKNSGHFIQLLKSVNLQSSDTLISFDVVSLFTNVPVDKALQVTEISSTTMTHWRNGLSCRSKPSWEPHIFRWTTSYSNRKMAWLWEAPCHPLWATSSWSILRNWLLTWHNINHRCGSGMSMTRLWSGLTVHRGYRISSATSVV
jgi:hypothetical protein